jgi:hypothetical protein
MGRRVISGVIVVVLIFAYPKATFGILCAAFIAALIYRAARGEKKQPTDTRQSVMTTRAEKTPAASDEHYPTPPVLPEFYIGKSRGSEVDVVGEYYRPESFQRIINKEVLEFDGSRYRGCGRFQLADDSANPHDSQAISIWFAGEHIGYLSRSDARRYRPDINRATQLGYTITTSGYLWIGIERGFNPIAQIWLPQPGRILPANDVPQNAVFLPEGDKIQVTKEEEHMPILRKWLKRSASDVPILFTLKAILDVRARSTVDIIQVCIGDEPIGVLTKTMSEKLTPLVEHVESRAKTPVVYGTITGNSIKCEAAFWCARASEVSEEWLENLGPKKVRVRYERPEFEWDDPLPAEKHQQPDTLKDVGEESQESS